jgi:hypothetical protein
MNVGSVNDLMKDTLISQPYEIVIYPGGLKIPNESEVNKIKVGYISLEKLRYALENNREARTNRDLVMQQLILDSGGKYIVDFNNHPYIYETHIYPQFLEITSLVLEDPTSVNGPQDPKVKHIYSKRLEAWEKLSSELWKSIASSRVGTTCTCCGGSGKESGWYVHESMGMRPDDVPACSKCGGAGGEYVSSEVWKNSFKPKEPTFGFTNFTINGLKKEMVRKGIKLDEIVYTQLMPNVYISVVNL